MPKSNKQANRPNPKLLASVKVANGFTLSQVRKIRGKLRIIAASSKKYKENIGYTSSTSQLVRSFMWGNTVEGYEYWKKIWITIEKCDTGDS